MKLQWDELCILKGFLDRWPQQWIDEVERAGFDSQVATAIHARVAKMASDETEAYMAKFGESQQRPATRKCVLQASKTVTVNIPKEGIKNERREVTYDIQLEYNPMDGWYWTRVPGHLAFLLLTRDIERMQEMLEARGWKWKYVEGSPHANT